MTLRTVYLLSSLVAVIGCTHEGNVQIQHPAYTAPLQSGISTKHDVHQQLGQPTDVRYIAGAAQWRYLSVATTMNGATFVPFYGLFAGGNTLTTTQVMVHFSLGKFRHLDRTVSRRSQNNWVALGEAQQSTEPQRHRVAREMTAIGLPFDADAWKQASTALKMQPRPE